jgi:hypothetical protein
MAQMVEQRIRNAQVAGSNPATSSSKINAFSFWQSQKQHLVCGCARIFKTKTESKKPPVWGFF